MTRHSLNTGSALRTPSLTPRHQRFCPLCERAFADGEAVLRCEGCEVMHHPACWVKNNGCVTNTEHQSVPIAIAYLPERLAGAEAPHPGEGTRVVPPDPGRAPIAMRQRPQAEAAPTVTDPPDDGMVIGEDAQPPPLRTVPPPAPLAGATVTRKPAASRAYKADRSGKPMPNLYARHRFLQFWYVPAAVLLAVGVAFAVIWVAGLFDDGDSNPADTAEPTRTTGPATAAASTTPSASRTLSPAAGTTTALASTVPGGKFQANDAVTVTGVGAGTGSEAGCLNVRTEPGTGNPAIVCVPDGTQLTVVGGPQEAGGLKWWKVRLASGEGWAAEDYLVKR